MAEAVAQNTKWKGLLVPALKKVQKQVQPTLIIDVEALVYLEELIIQLLYQMCNCQPYSVPDVKQKIENSFPPQIKDWAIGSAEAAIEKGKKKTLTLSVDKLQPLIQKEVLGYKIDSQVAMYIIAVLEYISADILKLAGNYVKNIRHNTITTQDVKVAMYADKVLMSMFHSEDMESLIEPVPLPFAKRGSLLYIDILKDFMMAEEQYLRELNLIIKVFRQPMVEARHVFSEEDLDKLFSNIMDIHEVTVQFYGMLETTFEMADDNSGREPLIGDVLEEMAEAAEFECYDTYAYEQVSGASQEQVVLGTYGKIKDMLEDYDVKEYFQKKGLYDAVKYILPKLLYGPIYHCSDCFEYIRLLMCTSPDGADREKLDESLTAFRGLQVSIEKMCSMPPLKRSTEDMIFYQRRMGTAVPSSSTKMVSIQENIEGWEGKDLSQIASLFLKEGTLVRPAQDGKKATERKVFLFDNLMVCTKQNVRHHLTGFSQAEYRLKEKILLRKVEIIDHEDTEELKHCFEISDPSGSNTLFCCKDDVTKYEWMSFLMTLQHRSTLDRMLDVILQEEEQSIQLHHPDPSLYKFAEEDSDENIKFEDSGEDDTGIPVLKGGTLYKLVERLTYHKYADPTFIRVFLTTYRSFSNPVELLDLLIERYDIPEPTTIANGSDKPVVTREELKRFRKEYSHPIQLRVLNVLRHWVDQHFYDFQREETLLSTLQKFLSRVVRSKTARKWVETIEKIVNRRLETASVGPEVYTFSTSAPAFEWHLTNNIEKFSLLTLHPLEIGRQLTIMQSEIFRSIKPSELVGTVWVKKDKEKLSPNALKMIHLSTFLTFWYELSICETHNFEERVAVYTRIIDILMVFIELNNFNGMMEILGAINSAPVHRLRFTTGELSPKRMQALQYVKELTDDGHNVKYTEKLRSINPPCVPFLGVYLSNILKAEEGNPDFLPNCPDGIINFSKRRMVADITGEIQKYQNMPYNLQIQPQIKKFIEELDPFAGRTDQELKDHLYESSLMIEPRQAKQPTKFVRKSDIHLKSPGIKAGSRTQSMGRKPSSSSQMTDVEPTPILERRRPPSPTPSTMSSFSTFTINEDEPDGGEKEEDEVIEEPPPLLLPRAPKSEERLPELPSKPVGYKKQFSLPARPETISRSFSLEDAQVEPPSLPPRTPAALRTNQETAFALPANTPPVPHREGERQRAQSDIGPPSLPSRRSKPKLLHRSSEPSIEVVPEVTAPPEIPPRKV